MATFASALFKAKAKKKRVSAPSDPPLGSYDPTIDAQGRQLQRNYDDTLQNFGIGKQRSSDDLALALSQLGQSKDQNIADLQRSQSRNLADLLTGRSRSAEDHAAALANLNRRYGILANQQGQADRRAHVESTGILAQQLAKRSANQALDQQPIDTSFQRESQDSAQAQSRLSEDFATATDRVGTQASQRSDALKLAFDRAFGPSGDSVLNIARAGRDLNAGQLDANAQKWYSAAANGYSPIIPRRKTRRQVIV